MRTAPFASLRSLFAISDEQAMWRVQTQDDERAFAQLVRRWEGPIQRLGARMTGDVHRGEDLAQETFARVFAKRKDYQPSGKFSTWLWRIALNFCYDELRRRQRREESSLDGMCGEAVAGVANRPTPNPIPIINAAAAAQRTSGRWSGTRAGRVGSRQASKSFRAARQSLTRVLQSGHTARCAARLECSSAVNSS